MVKSPMHKLIVEDSDAVLYRHAGLCAGADQEGRQRRACDAPEGLKRYFRSHPNPARTFCGHSNNANDTQFTEDELGPPAQHLRGPQRRRRTSCRTIWQRYASSVWDDILH